MYFAALEVKSHEAPEAAIRHFITVAADHGIKFQRIQTFGPFEFAGVRFVRFQTDCPTFPPIIARLKASGRSVIAPTTTGYKAFLGSGREGQVGVVLMQGVALPGHSKTYLGPSHPHCMSQFTP